MYFNIKCIGKLPGLTIEFERSLVFETGEFERPKFDCICYVINRGSYMSAHVLLNLLNKLGKRLAEHLISFSQRV